MTPTENHAAMQLPFGANASRLAAFTGKLIDIAFHQSGTLESHLERRLQFLQGIAQGGPPAAELVEGCFILHATTIYRIQISAPQSEKSTPLSKMFSDDQARFALAGFRKELIAVSESQLSSPGGCRSQRLCCARTKSNSNGSLMPRMTLAKPRSIYVLFQTVRRLLPKN